MVADESKKIQALERLVEDQKRIIAAQQHELQWLQGVIFNPAFNEIDMRLLVTATPREMRMGLTSDVPEKKVYMPALAEKAHCSPKVASQHIRTLRDAGAFSYRTEQDPDTGNTRAFLATLPAAEKPTDITFERAKRGGSTWENGKRVKRCLGCGSENLLKKSEIICANCGQSQGEPTYTPVNVTPDSQYDSRGTDEDVTPDCHIDTEPPKAAAPAEVPKLPPTTVDTVGVDTEEMEPPEELRTLCQWVVWRYEQEEEGKKPKKVPYQAKRGRAILKASTTDPATWATYEQARTMFEEAITFKMKERFDGIGFVFNHDYTGVDFDHCIHDGQIDEEALVRIMELFTYSEVSPSCTGVHAIARGTIPAGCKRPDIEMYCEGRFFTWTGQRLTCTPPTIEARQEQITALYEEIAPPHQAQESEPGASPTCVYDVASADERDAGQLEQAGELALKKANGAANNAKFAQLWSGEIAGYGSQSEADLALCRMLAYWTDNDAALMDHLFRKSKLYRPKWDRSVGRSETYGQRTIGRAIQGLQEKVSA